MKSNLIYTINKKEVNLDIECKSLAKQQDEILFFKDKCGLKTSWNSAGYVITDKLKYYFPIIKQNISKIIYKNLNTIKKTKEFDLQHYHKHVNNTEHLQLVKKIAAGRFGINGIDLDELDISHKIFDNVVSDLCKKRFTMKKTFFKIYTNNKFWLRIVRPGKNDNNPPHRDCYLSRNKGIINIYMPLAGSNELSSLPILPASHLWNENALSISKGRTLVDGCKFTNPCIVKSDYPLELITPNPKPGEAMVFTPYLIHGGGRNFNDDMTRISLEMRFWPL
jgi:hypothetical protein